MTSSTGLWRLTTFWTGAFGGLAEDAERLGEEPTVDMHETETRSLSRQTCRDTIPRTSGPESVRFSDHPRDSLERDRRRQGGYYLRGRQSDGFSGPYGFLPQCMLDKAVAKYKDGVLRITAPKVAKNLRRP